MCVYYINFINEINLTLYFGQHLIIHKCISFHSNIRMNGFLALVVLPQLLNFSSFAYPIAKVADIFSITFHLLTCFFRNSRPFYSIQRPHFCEKKNQMKYFFQSSLMDSIKSHMDRNKNCHSIQLSPPNNVCSSS